MKSNTANAKLQPSSAPLESGADPSYTTRWWLELRQRPIRRYFQTRESMQLLPYSTSFELGSLGDDAISIHALFLM
jgi:hypothetical protein